MKHLMVLGCALLAALALSGSATTQPDSDLSLDQYKATVSQEVFRDLEAKGLDIVAAEQVESGKVEIDVVLSKEQVLALRAKDIDLQVRRNQFGQSARQFAATQAVNGFAVWDDYDSPDGHRAQLYELARENPQLTKLVVLDHTIQGREIIALKITQGARKLKDGRRPAVLYSATQHAREWIAPETNSRLLNYFVDQWNAGNQEIRKLLKQNEYWFVIVANPDGYQYTFASEDTRLWRKNLRDNNGNGTTEIGDGVDPNRNFPEHWKYDEEGSSSIPSSETYRGPAPASEAETQAIQRLYGRVDFAFHVNWHSAGQWLLYPEGWQIGTPTADDPIYFALSGNLDNPAIPEFHPGLSSDVLYVTNGEMTDWTHAEQGALSWVPELSEGCDGCGFVFPDDEELVQAEFERVLPFSLDVAKSAKDPDDPVSHLGLETKPFYFKSDDTYKTGVPGANFTFAVSYGDPQEIRILAKRDVKNVRLKYRINDGRVRSTGAFKWRGGETYGGQTDVYYHVLRGFVRKTEPGDEVTVWFEGKLRDDDRKGKRGKRGGKRVESDSFTYTAAAESRNDVLILAAEDYTGASPVQATGPNYLSYYQDALEANGIGYDVYDIDANGRQAATMLGVLSHYDAVIWYTGDDVITREPGWGPGNASRLAMDSILHVRAYLNEGGKALWTGKYAGFQYSTNQAQAYDPTAENAQCSALPDTVDPRRCLILHGSGDVQNDVLEYWFGGYLLNFGAGLSEDNIFDVLGVDTPFDSLTLVFNGADSAQNGDNANSFIATSGILPPDEFPQFESWVSAKYDRPGGPFDPHTGESYAYSQIADVSYKRLTRSIAVPAGDPAPLSFWTSYNTETDWDFLFVEAIDAAGNRTTLPSAFTGTSTGQSCPSGWFELHPWLEEYQAADCSGPKWNAASGDSQGWQEWVIDLDAYAGQTVEISISYASDWATQGLGVFVDDITLPDGSSTSFEGGDTGGWVVSGPPPGSASNVNDFVFTTAAGFPEGAAITTEDTLLLGFGFEAITGADTRAEVMGRAMDYLLDD